MANLAFCSPVDFTRSKLHIDKTELFDEKSFIMKLKSKDSSYSASIDSNSKGKHKKGKVGSSSCNSPSKVHENEASCSSPALESQTNDTNNRLQAKDNTTLNGEEIRHSECGEITQICYNIKTLNINNDHSGETDKELTNTSSEGVTNATPDEAFTSNINGSSSLNENMQSTIDAKSNEVSPAIDTVAVDVTSKSTPDSGLSDCGENGYSSSSPLHELPDTLVHPVDEDVTCTNEVGKALSKYMSTSDSKICMENGLSPAYEDFYGFYMFVIPQELCGLLIGRNGRYVKFLKSDTKVDILIRHHPMLRDAKLCIVIGTQSQINNALHHIRDRFPVDQYPELTLEALHPSQPEMILSHTQQLSLPDSAHFEALISSVISPGHVFLHQPTHLSYYQLPMLLQSMTQWYNQNDAPSLLRVAPGNIVAVPIDNMWYRAEVVDAHVETEQCTLRYLDYGGYSVMSLHDLRQMRYEFSSTPFQAAECYVANITYLEGEEGWSAEAKQAFEDLTQGRILRAYVIGYSQDEIPCIILYNTSNNENTCINEELVNRGLARWIEPEEKEQH